MLCLIAGDLAAAGAKLHILEEKIAVTQHANLLLAGLVVSTPALCRGTL